MTCLAAGFAKTIGGLPVSEISQAETKETPEQTVHRIGDTISAREQAWNAANPLCNILPGMSFATPEETEELYQAKLRLPS